MYSIDGVQSYEKRRELETTYRFVMDGMDHKKGGAGVQYEHIKCDGVRNMLRC